jgi:multisubunit Na+/H+ antiporter MnhE subunit/energy-converting hydrogenase Eha subunit H
MVTITGIMAVAVSVYGLVNGAELRERALYHPLYHGLLLGVAGAFLTGDLFNLYVWFEVMLIASFGLLVVGGSREQLDAGVKYVTLNLVATTFFLIAVAFLYGATGTLNMADLARALPGLPNQGLVTTLAVLLLIAFASKAALFPLFFWLPASYHTASAPVMAIFAALLTKVGVYAIIRVFTLMFDGHSSYLGPIIGVVAGLTMVTGVLGAASHFDIRRILSFHIISQIGYMLIGVAVATPLALAGSILYVLHHIVVKANLFLIAGAVKLAGGSYDLRQVGGLHRSAPMLAVLFLIPAMSLAAPVGVLGQVRGDQVQPGRRACGPGGRRPGRRIADSLLDGKDMERSILEGRPRTFRRRQRKDLDAIAGNAGGHVGPHPGPGLHHRHDRTCNRTFRRLLSPGGKPASRSGSVHPGCDEPALPGNRKDRGQTDGGSSMKVIHQARAWASLAGSFFRELLMSVKEVVLTILHPRRVQHSAIVAVPLDVSSDLGISLLANMITLTPGTTSLHVSEDRKVLYVHVMNHSENTVAQIKSGFERKVMEVLP